MLVIEKLIKDLQNDIREKTPEEIIEKHGLLYTCRFCSIRGQQPPCDMKCMEHIKEKLFAEYERPYDLTFEQMRKMSEANQDLWFERNGVFGKYKISDGKLKWARKTKANTFHDCTLKTEYIDAKYRVYEPEKE
ncbi:MAG: hypothetical protein ACOXZ0_07000 [Eubacteriales bacterium]|jgi:hypothetical protein